MVHSTRKPKVGPPPNSFKPAEFVNVQLDQSQREELKASNWTHEEFDSAFAVLCADGYSLKLRYDERNDCFAAWLLASEGHKNYGYILAGRGSTPMKAVKQLVYIHMKILSGDWYSEQPQERGEIDD